MLTLLLHVLPRRVIITYIRIYIHRFSFAGRCAFHFFGLYRLAKFQRLVGLPLFLSAQNVIGVCPASPQVRTPPKGNLEPLHRYYVSYLVGRYTWVPTGSTVNNDIGEKTRQKLMTRKTIEVLYLSFGQTFQTDGGSTIATEALPNHCN